MKVCISGSRSIRTLPAAALAHLDDFLSLGAEILVGDEPYGVDTHVQRVLAARGYRAVTVWHRGTSPRSNVGGWPTRAIAGSYTDRDRAMCSASEAGLAVWDGRSPGTGRNIRQLGDRMRVVRA
jgi:adenine-specific DNA-methyltransferase